MAKETSGYTAPQYFYWKLLDGGGKYISNYKTNYVMNQYNDGYGKYWDNPKKKVYDEYEYDGWCWEYIYVNDDHPTVSGDGANLTGTGKNDEIHNDGVNANINAGAGNDTIGNDGNNVTVNAGTGKDTIGTNGSNVTIDTGTGKDTIENKGSNVSINATADGKADSISNDGGENVTILAGAGKDTIVNAGSKVKINAGEGDNYINNSYDGYVNYDDRPSYKRDRTTILAGRATIKSRATAPLF